MSFGALLQRAFLNCKCQVLVSGASPNLCKTRVALALPHPGYTDRIRSKKQLQQLEQLICWGDREKKMKKREKGKRTSKEF